MKSILSKVPRVILAIYLLWIILHLYLFSSSDLFDHDRDFYPFDGFRTSDYDYTEFLVYLIVPILLYIAFYLIKPDLIQRMIDKQNKK